MKHNLERIKSTALSLGFVLTCATGLAMSVPQLSQAQTSPPKDPFAEISKPSQERLPDINFATL